jgi:hypothetical protein
MPERWERELDELRHMEMREPAIRERIEQGSTVDSRSSRKHSLLAGIVAGAVAVAGIAALWQLDRDPGGIGDTTADLPTLAVTFQSGRMMVNQPDEQIQRVETTIVYGDAREESFTSTISESAHVDWVGVEDLSRFVPGPTAGSQVRFDADGDDARVLIGHPADWPEFDRFTEIDRLPEEPGDYVLLFEATYAEGIARTARFVQVVAPGVLQLEATEGKSLYAAKALGYLDGRRVDGFLSQSWFSLGDVDAESEPATPDFEPDGWLSLQSGSPVTLVAGPSEARAGLVPSYGDFDLTDALPIDLLGSATIEGPAGRQLLAVDATWIHGPHPTREEPTEERAVFFFPIEIVAASESNESSPEPTPSPNPTSPGVVTVDIRRSSEETGDPEAIARFGPQEEWMCPDGWDVVNPDGSHEQIAFDCGQETTFTAPAGTSIAVTGDFASVNATARLSTSDDRTSYPADAVPAIDPGSVVFYQYEVTWDDGSEASFWLLLTVESSESPSSVDTSQIVVKVFGMGERSNESPVATFSYGGETKTACLQDFGWTREDGTSFGMKVKAIGRCDGRAIEVPPGTSIAIESATTTRVSTTRATTQFFEGDVGLVVTAEWSNGHATFVIPLNVASGTPDLELVVLDCRPEEQVEFSGPDVRILPGGSSYIVGNLPGFQRSDVVEQMTREANGDTEWSGVWQVVRDGRVVASVDWDALSGTACRGSGIGGA